MGGVSAVKDAVELGVFEGLIKSIGDVGFAGGDFGIRDESVFATADAVEISGELRRSSGQSATKRETDGAELRGFKMRVIGSEGGIEVFGAHVELLGKVADLSGAVTKGGADGEEDEEKDEAGEEDFDDERGAGAGASSSSWAVRLSDVIKIFKIIHKVIIARKRGFWGGS